MLKTISLLLFVLAASCHQQPRPIANEAIKVAPVTPARSIPVRNTTGYDSLRDPRHFYYLSDLPTSSIGRLILADSLKAVDNEVSFRCLDSLSSADPERREFYFLVFKRIIANSDGALNEIVGQFSKKYIESHPREFASHATAFTKPQMQLWAFQTFEHVLAAVEQKQFKTADQWTQKIIQDCSGCTTAELRALQQFNQLVLQASKDRDVQE